MRFPDYHNAPVPSFGGLEAELLIVGLAPGLHGANATGRPFTGDYAGDILYAALQKHGLATGRYQQRADDGFTLIDCRITNAVRCVPPENKPVPEEIRTCNRFLKNEIAAMPNLKVILSLGQISHNAVIRALGLKAAHHKFVHGFEHAVEIEQMEIKPRDDDRAAVVLLNSYHTSRYNINTGVLTREMFDGIVGQVKKLMAASSDRRKALQA